MQSTQHKVSTAKTLILPIALAVGISIGLSFKSTPPTYLTVVFEDNHFIAEPEPSLIPVPVAQAYEEPKMVVSDPVEQLIRDTFGEDAEEALIVAKCESGLNPKAHGDTNIMVINAGDHVGDSIGVFQIRTGGKDFNRARANGMTPDEFREWMWDAEENVKYAKTIYDRQGWHPWTCKKDLL